ncbi:PP2C family protein-serine/threonine phosphatase [candidate division KSB1 bacterium]|nr:PP2C family protein-serine/threonine phosphatase [candidate division KSB1 bacterium]
MKFLPSDTPDYPYVQIEAICQPAQEIGGDYYDFFPYDDERLGLIIGDVSGKGVHAAFYMTMVKGIIKTLAKEVTSPREILCKLNRIFYENAPRKVFISVIYGVFDFKTGILTYARAGHLPLIVWCENHKKTLQKIPAGMAIGLDSGDKFDDLLEEATCILEPGDLFLFFTDGISEAGRADGEEFGEERLKNILSRFAGNSPDIILEEIKDNVLRFIGKSGRHDDITAIAVQMKDDYKINT